MRPASERVKRKAGSLLAVPIEALRPFAAATLLATALASPVHAQGRGGDPTLQDLALAWAMGVYKGPVVCPLPEGPRRVARTVSIQPPRRADYRPMFDVVIESLEVPDVRCTNDLGGAEPDVVGRFRIAIQGHARPDVARKDFQTALKRDGGFTFEVPSGQVEIRDPEGGARRVRLAGGKAQLTRIARGSDAARMIGDVGDKPRRTLELEAPDGTRLVFQLVLIRPH